MKKRNLLISLLSLALVAVIGVGATLAYLTDETQTATNTFEMDGISIALQEDASVLEGEVYQIKKTEDDTYMTEGTITGAEKGIDYKDLVPGATVAKKPYVTVTADSADAYVYVYVTGANTMMPLEGVKDPVIWIDGWSAGWETVTTDAAGTLLRQRVDKNTNDVKLDVFTTVKVNPALTEKVEDMPEITIAAFAHQADNVELAVADAAAKTHFGIQ